jgi:hypothetical protein
VVGRGDLSSRTRVRAEAQDQRLRLCPESNLTEADELLSKVIEKEASQSSKLAFLPLSPQRAPPCHSSGIQRPILA